MRCGWADPRSRSSFPSLPQAAQDSLCHWGADDLWPAQARHRLWAGYASRGRVRHPVAVPLQHPLFSPSSPPFQTCHPLVHATPNRLLQMICPDHTRLHGAADGPSYPCCPGILPTSIGLLHKRIGILPKHVHVGCVMATILVATRTKACLFSQGALSRNLLCATPGFAIL